MTINYTKSIGKGHVVTNKFNLIDHLEDSLNYFPFVVLIILLVPVPVYMLIVAYINNDLSVNTIFFSGLLLTFGIYLIFCLNNWKRLIKIEGIDLPDNKKILIPTIEAYFPELNFEWDGNILIASKPYDYWRMRYGIEVVVIFSDRDIYLNILSTYRGPIPWTAFSNIEKSRELGRLVKEKFYTLKSKRYQE